MPTLQFKEFTGPHLMPASSSGEDWEPEFYYVSAFCPLFGDDLIIARFDWDNTCMDANHYKEQAKLLAQKFVGFMNV